MLIFTFVATATELVVEKILFLPLREISERGIAIIVVVRPSVRGQNFWGGFLSPWIVLKIILLCFPEG